MNVQLSTLGCDFSTRHQGLKCQAQLREILLTNPQERVVISLAGVTAVTPSFADECFGKMLLEYGPEEFKKRIGFVDGNETVTTLLKVVLSQRQSEWNAGRTSNRLAS